jgi:hypothetical protein
MKLIDVALGATDWTGEPASVQAGVTGSATVRARQLGDVQLRMVDYGAGYVADHWCHKGHVLTVVSGALVIAHQDGTRFALTAGMTWHVGDGEASPHKVVCETGARVFIVD